MRRKIHNAQTNRWVYLDGASAKKYLDSISYREVVPHPLEPDHFVIVIDSEGREVPTPFPNPKSLSEEDDGATQPKSVRFSPSTKLHDGLSPSMAFLEGAAQIMFSSRIEDFDVASERFFAALDRAKSQVHVMDILSTVVGAMNRGKSEPGESTFLINRGSSSLMYDPSDQRHTTALLVILQGCKLFIERSEIGRRPLPFSS